ncbi:hypothetical protein [Paenarthrobacter ilicis]|uniref:hypothetical protein n=1 Tax=Paenarthrobacter ilicis TaxID=43665 RepID=UPI0038696999
MNKNALRGLAVSGLLVMGLTACGGGSTPTDPSAASKPLTTTPTQVPFKTYTKAELGKMVDEVRDSNDVRLLVMPDDRLEDTLKQTKAIATNSTVEPAACADFTLGDGILLNEGATLSIGASASSTADSLVLLTLVSGLTEDKVKEFMTSKTASLDACGTVQATVMGQNVEASTKSLPTAAKTDGAVAYKSSAIAPGSGSQDQLIVTAAKGGIVIISKSAGKTVQDTDLTKLESMLDQAAALIK